MRFSINRMPYIIYDNDDFIPKEVLSIIIQMR